MIIHCFTGTARLAGVLLFSAADTVCYVVIEIIGQIAAGKQAILNAYGRGQSVGRN